MINLIKINSSENSITFINSLHIEKISFNKTKCFKKAIFKKFGSSEAMRIWEEYEKFCSNLNHRSYCLIYSNLSDDQLEEAREREKEDYINRQLYDLEVPFSFSFSISFHLNNDKKYVFEFETKEDFLKFIEENGLKNLNLDKI